LLGVRARGTSSLNRRYRLRPLRCTSELAVNAVTRPAEQIERLKRLSQNLFGKHALNDRHAFNVNIRLRRRIRRDSLRTLKIVVVVAPAAAEGQCNGEARTAPSGLLDRN
jgi:hypothetical protein